VADDFSDGIELPFYDCEKGICTGKTFANGGSGSPRRGPNFVAPISHEEPAQAIHRLGYDQLGAHPYGYLLRSFLHQKTPAEAPIKDSRGS